MSNYISPNATIHNDVYIGDNVKIYGNTIIGKKTVIEDNVIIGKPSNQEIIKLREDTTLTYNDLSIQNTKISENCIIGSGTVIYSGASLGIGVEIEDYCMVGANTSVGKKTRLMYRCLVYNRVKIGENCRIAGFICNETIIENYVSFFGKTLHKYNEYSDKSKKSPTPIIKDGAIIGFDALIVGGVIIEKNTFVKSKQILSNSNG